MILYFVRHGETELNVNHILQGSAIDEPLDSEGIKEIQALLPNLPKDFAIIYSSPHKRVLQSAEIIKDYSGKEIEVRTELEERNFGSLTGKKWDEIPDGQELRTKDQNQEYDYRPYGGESVEDVTARLESFLQLAKKSELEAALAVSSIGIIRLLYKILLNERVVEVENGSIHRFEI
jgi:broad specificity phosphatase PhoE